MLIINHYNKPQTPPKISTELVDNGMVNGKREFIFSLENFGQEDVELQFLSWLEYNYGLDYETDQDVVSLNGKTEHIDLNEESEARTLLLKSNQRVEYRIHLSGYQEGEYEITVSPAIYGFDLGFRRLQFVIE
ncbi:hypothetical protein ACFYKX_12865 [Cytobacillus sp. FJAT-54145]|uniref:Intracellular proteinase inhibitor BsuPI domain-containing protein n=1 Tax=Cytobacillus spartinae TaxID=3299023 RepID=A0ABW6KB73_9BACI